MAPMASKAPLPGMMQEVNVNVNATLCRNAVFMLSLDVTVISVVHPCLNLCIVVVLLSELDPVELVIS